MKKTLLLIAVGCISAALISGHLCAQDQKDQAALASSATVKAPPATASGSSSANTANSTISQRAMKDFKGRFTNAKNEQWFPINTGFVAYFKVDSFQQRIFYDKKGRWEASMRDLTEKQLPRDIRAIVKSSYYDFAITLVRVVEIPDHMVYIIHMEDEKNIMIVRVSELGEMDVLEEFTKQR
ncbi:MAG TPA: PepSY-like domain-containing protein [Puia sp.]|nr:PepSY-like domain-containing protein [Puia sp.]